MLCLFLAGTPSTKSSASISLITIEPAAINAFSPTTISGMAQLPIPKNTLLPKITLPANEALGAK